MRGLATAVAVLASIATALGVVHGLVFVPMVLQQADQLIEKRIEIHSRVPHHTSVTRDEFKLILDRLERIERKIDVK